jgi:hypothetical protein
MDSSPGISPGILIGGLVGMPYSVTLIMWGRGCGHHLSQAGHEPAAQNTAKRQNPQTRAR